MKNSLLVHSLLHRSALDYPDKTVLVHGDERISYGELSRLSNLVSLGLLNRGLRPGDRVGVLTDQAIEYVASYFGIMGAGGIVVGLNTQTAMLSLRLNILFPTWVRSGPGAWKTTSPPCPKSTPKISAS